MKPDEITMKIVQTIANNIDENIKVTFDIPSNHTDNMVPILDIKACVNTDGNIDYVFYKKPIASKFVTHKESAMSVKQKHSILTQQCFIRLHNTSNKICDDIKAQQLTDFMQEMQSSGYSENDRFEVLKSALKTYQNLKEKESSGKRPFYRDKHFRKPERKAKKAAKKNTWFKGENGEFKTVMFVPPTPGDKLLKMLRHIEQKHQIASNMRIKFVSKSGSKLINQFRKKDPFEAKCSRNDCGPCDSLDTTKSKTSKCRSNNVTYSAQCVECEKEGRTRVYIGETSRNMYIRSCEHYNALKNKNENSFMFKHIKKEHTNQGNIKFKWKVL